MLMLNIKIDCYGQSASAFERAGDKSIERKDPLSAISYYNQAIDYGESATLCYKLGEAFNLLHDYSIAYNWYMAAYSKAKNDPELSLNAIIKSADLLKCLGKFDDASRLLLNQKYLTKNDSIQITRLTNGIAFAAKLSLDSLPLVVNQIGDEINSKYSDISPTQSGDSILYFSSMRFFVKDKTENQKLTSKILSSKILANQFSKSEVLPKKINSIKYNIANPSVSPDHKLMIFSQCLEDGNNNLICSLLESKYKNGAWETPILLNDSVNLKNYTSTQPCITTNGNDGYLLYFSSNRPIGFGKNDIWVSKRSSSGAYSSPENLGPLINSVDDEITPFFDAMTDTLYFSSDREDGLGGFDLLATAFQNKLPQNTIHLRPPINSGYNDLYFSANYSIPRSKYLVSNRPPAEQINEGACCYDLFKIDNPPPSKKDSLPPPLEIIPLVSLPLSQIPIDSISKLPVEIILSKLNDFLPLRLYFDNDYPDPKTRKTTTQSSFNDLTASYLQKLPEYQDAHKSDLLEKENLKIFFNDSIAMNFKKLEKFSSIIAELLHSGNSLKLLLQGCASPLADNAYNLTLSSRRISSLRNYWMLWNAGILKEFILSGMLILNDDPKGERLATVKVNDRLDNKAASVYSIAAALERRIEVTDISLQKP